MESDSNPMNGMNDGQCRSGLLVMNMGKTDQAIAAIEGDQLEPVFRRSLISKKGELS